jgi:hypothetical protein
MRSEGFVTVVPVERGGGGDGRLRSRAGTSDVNDALYHIVSGPYISISK